MKKRSLIILLLAYTALWFICRSTVEYTVTFDPSGGELVSGELVQRVKIRKDALAPQLENGRLALCWDGSFENIRQDTVVTARWEKVPLSRTALEEYLRPRTVKVCAVYPDGSEARGAGFFIDGHGRAATSFGLIAGAEKITVELSDGMIRKVGTVTACDAVRDLAVLETGVENSPWLETAAAVAAGDDLYGWNESVTALQTGALLQPETALGAMPCVESELDSGAAGEPLVDVYGDLAAVRHGLGHHRELAVRACALEELAVEEAMTLKEFQARYNTERFRSYEVPDGQGYRPIMARTYHMVTGEDCSYSVLGGARYEGYFLRFDSYIYEYSPELLAVYTAYLEENGYLSQEAGAEAAGVSLCYRNPAREAELQLQIREETGELEIRPMAVPAEE